MEHAVKPLTVMLALLAATSHVAFAQSTAFTYQGDFQQGGAPANGPHDVRFRLFDAPNGGAQVGITICVDNVPVAVGLFTATIDFGTAFANASSRHLEVEVHQDSGLDCANTTGYTTLSPRQAITPAPRATAANTAFSLSAPDGSPTSALFVDSAGNVGIGTTTPNTPLGVRAPSGGELPGAGVRIQGFSSGVGNLAYMDFRNATSTRIGYVGDGGGGDDSIYLHSDSGSVHLSTSFGDAVSATPSGDVGIGTPIPTARLDVRGDIRLGSTGQYLAPAAQENLRIVRGAVFSDGNIQAGSGFSVTPTATGIYTVTFSQPFTSMPVIAATARSSPTQSVMNLANIDNVTSTSFQVRVTWLSGSLQKGPFHFIAVGPR
jgi:hypothetical protein